VDEATAALDQYSRDVAHCQSFAIQHGVDRLDRSHEAPIRLLLARLIEARTSR